MPVVSDTRLSLSVDEFGGGGSGTIRVQEFGVVGSDDEMALPPLHLFEAIKWPCISLREATQIAKCYANRAVENVKHTRPLIPSMIQKKERLTKPTVFCLLGLLLPGELLVVLLWN